jgi:hypothetical protein
MIASWRNKILRRFHVHLWQARDILELSCHAFCNITVQYISYVRRYSGIAKHLWFLLLFHFQAVLWVTMMRLLNVFVRVEVKILKLLLKVRYFYTEYRDIVGSYPASYYESFILKYSLQDRLSYIRGLPHTLHARAGMLTKITLKNFLQCRFKHVNLTASLQS